MKKHIKQYLSILVLLCTVSFVSGQSSFSKLKSEGDEFYKNELYQQALELYLEYQGKKPSDRDVIQKVAVCYLELAKPTLAFQNLELLLNKNPKDEVLQLAAIAKHKAHKFGDAIIYYKRYLGTLKTSKVYDRQLIKDEIIRCVSGMKIKREKKSRDIIENLGDKINSPYDDFAAIQSPNYSDKIYFSTYRDDNIGGKYDINNVPDPVHGKTKTDIFYGLYENGEWSSTHRMSDKINTEKNDKLLGFSHDGQRLFSARGVNSRESVLYSDEFYADEDIPNPQQLDSLIEGPYIESDAFFFKDSLLLFTSNRPEGYGGFDIYFTKLNPVTKEWSIPVNLGPEINTPYDEVNPFLTKNGRTLYFSSNNIQSMGGYDVFKGKYNEEIGKFDVSNLGFPVNSAADERNFRVTTSAASAYFDSSKSGGKGGRDIYVIYFKDQLTDHQKTASPLSFIQLSESFKQELAIEETKQKEQEASGIIEYAPEDMITYKLRSMVYNEEDETVISINNRNNLSKVIEAMTDYPKVKLQVICHSDNSGSRPFSFYSSYQKGLEIYEYLLSKGINPANVTINAHGDIYPAAKNKDYNGTPSKLGMKLNRVIDLKLYNLQNTPLIVEYDDNLVSSLIKTPERDDFYKRNAGLNYKILIKETTKVLNDNKLLSFKPDVAVESGDNKDNMLYLIGLAKTYQEAIQLRDEFNKAYPSYVNAYIVPYVDGIRVADEDLESQADTYPDLYRYLNY